MVIWCMIEEIDSLFMSPTNNWKFPSCAVSYPIMWKNMKFSDRVVHVHNKQYLTFQNENKKRDGGVYKCQMWVHQWYIFISNRHIISGSNGSQGDVVDGVADLNNVTEGISHGGDDIQLAARVATGIGLYMLAMVTCVGNGMVIHAIRTEKRLRKVSAILCLIEIKRIRLPNY